MCVEKEQEDTDPLKWGWKETELGYFPLLAKRSLNVGARSLAAANANATNRSCLVQSFVCVQNSAHSLFKEQSLSSFDSNCV